MSIARLDAVLIPEDTLGIDLKNIPCTAEYMICGLKKIAESERVLIEALSAKDFCCVKTEKSLLLKIATVMLPLILLSVIVLLCFSRTLGSYFVADDLSQVCYAGRVVNGDWQALISNFTGNYLQNPVMRIYRPLLLLSLVVDCAIWRANPFGYFLSDVLFLSASAFMLYVFLRQLTRLWDPQRSLLFAILAAALFASSPLHCESVSFISGRDNLISAVFYLLCLWCFVRKGTSKNLCLTISGIAAFWAAMLSKEAAIGLPVVLAGIVVFFPDLFPALLTVKEVGSENPHRNFKDSLFDRIKLAVRQSLPLWVSTALYFVVRFLALGTLTGGYTAGFGASRLSDFINRFADSGTLYRMLFPLNLAVFGENSFFKISLLALYLVLSTIVLIKAITGRLKAFHLAWLAFFFIWMVTTAAPYYQLWGLSDNLQGARFYYFFSLATAAFTSFLVMAPAERAKERLLGSKSAAIGYFESTTLLGALCLITLVIVCIKITFQNNIPWVHAGRQARACRTESVTLAKSLPAGQKVAVIGLPCEVDGAHVIYNSATFNTMLAPPFSDGNYADRFITFEPLFYGQPQYINMQQLKRALRDPSVTSLCFWNDHSLKFEKLSRPPKATLEMPSSTEPIELKGTDALAVSLPKTFGQRDNFGHAIVTGEYGDFFSSSRKSFSPFLYDFIEFSIKASQDTVPFSVFSRGTTGQDWYDSRYPKCAVARGAISGTRVRIRLSDCWRWFAQGDISALKLAFFPAQQVAISDLKIVSARNLMPDVAMVNIQPGNDGVYVAQKDNLQLVCDGTLVRNCAAVRVEISKPNYFFDGLSAETFPQAVMKTIDQAAQKSKFKIDPSIFSEPAYYQICVHCLDDHGTRVGERSDPITVQIFK